MRAFWPPLWLLPTMVSPIPMRPADVSAHASELIWQNLPPARVWVYRKAA